MNSYQSWIWQLPDWHAMRFDAQRIVNTSKPTAARDLIELERMGLLTKFGDGRSTRYYPAIEGWAEDGAKISSSS